MAERGRSADPRAERVRTRLRQAALALAGERSVDEISVGDLVSHADVSRQVFYRHFRDRDDAIAAAFSHLFAEPRASADDAKARILDLFRFAAEHAALFRHVVPSTVNQHVLVTYRDALRTPCEQIACQGMVVLDTITPISTDAVTRFLVGGFTEVLRSWMEDPDATDLHLRIGVALDTVDALLGISSAQKGPSRG